MPQQLINPESIRPEYGWQPDSGLAGMLYSTDRRRYENLANMQDQMMSAQRDMTLEELVQGAPTRQAAREGIVRDLPVKSRQLEASTIPLELEAQYQESMFPGRQKIGLGKQQLESGQQSIAQLVQAISQVTPGPDYIARLGGLIMQSGVDPNQGPIREILSTDNPQEAQRRAMAFVQQQSLVDPDYKKTMAGIGLRGEYDLERQRIANLGAVQSVRAQLSSKNKTAVQLLRESGSPIELVTRASVILSDPDMDTRTKETARKAIMSNWESYSRLVQKGELPPLPGFPSVRPLANPYALPGAAPQVARRFNPDTGKLEYIK